MKRAQRPIPFCFLRAILPTLALTLLLRPELLAEPGSARPASQNGAEVIRGEGSYILEKIIRVHPAEKELLFYRILFNKQDKPGTKTRSSESSGLWLETRAVHPGLKEGSSYRLRYSGHRIQQNTIRIGQTLIWLTTASGETQPVRMLSLHARQADFSGTPLLQLHAPSSDYLLF
ncbi:MAG: hypothetical protein H6618_03940 [Deltaproteobacteria bacterium]|nr:hypothetical protein [Deltaproteobacteria bacterium]